VDIRASIAGRETIGKGDENFVEPLRGSTSKLKLFIHRLRRWLL